MQPWRRFEEARSYMDELDTPALVIDLPRLKANVDAMARVAREGGVALRPLGLRGEGVMTHEGQAYGEQDLAAATHAAAAAMADAAAALEDPVVSLGSTPTARFAARERGVTEIRPGTYVFQDRTQVAHG